MKLITALTVLAILAFGSAAAAERMFSLRAVAAQSGYSYSWLAAEQAAAIERPGVVIVIRPGNPSYEINDALEFADSTPRSSAKGDILIPDSLVRRIRAAGRVQTSSALLAVDALNLNRAPVSGKLALSLLADEGQEAVIVRGTGPDSAPVTLTLLTTVSSDIPDIILSRHDLVTDRSGAFSVTIPIAPDFMRGTIVTVRATSLDGVVPAQAQLSIGPPHTHTPVPATVRPPVFSI